MQKGRAACTSRRGRTEENVCGNAGKFGASHREFLQSDNLYAKQQNVKMLFKQLKDAYQARDRLWEDLQVSIEESGTYQASQGK